MDLRRDAELLRFLSCSSQFCVVSNTEISGVTQFGEVLDNSPDD